MSAKQYFQKISLKKQYIIKFILLMLLPLLLIEIALYTIHLRTIQDDAVNDNCWDIVANSAWRREDI